MNLLVDGGFENETGSSSLEVPPLGYNTNFASMSGSGWFNMLYSQQADIVDDNGRLQPGPNNFAGIVAESSNDLVETGNRAGAIFGTNNNQGEGIIQYLQDGSGNAAPIASGTDLTLTFEAFGFHDFPVGPGGVSNTTANPVGGDDGEVTIEIIGWNAPNGLNTFSGGNDGLPNALGATPYVLATITIDKDAGTTFQDYGPLNFTAPDELHLFGFRTPSDSGVSGGIMAGNGVTIDNLVLIEDPGTPPCFTPDSLIQTVGGPKLIGDLEIGDQIETKDHPCVGSIPASSPPMRSRWMNVWPR